jgi:hypothetical protein
MAYAQTRASLQSSALPRCTHTLPAAVFESSSAASVKTSCQHPCGDDNGGVICSAPNTALAPHNSCYTETVRPMLLHGLPPRKDDNGCAIDDGAVSPRHRACLALGTFMELLLPALDANDEDKLLSALTFYSSVFSNCCAVEGTESGEVEGMRPAVYLGIDMDAFAPELLRRIFAAVDTLQSGKQSMAIGDEDACALCLCSDQPQTTPLHESIVTPLQADGMQALWLVAAQRPSHLPASSVHSRASSNVPGLPACMHLRSGCSKQADLIQTDHVALKQEGPAVFNRAKCHAN